MMMSNTILAAEDLNNAGVLSLHSGNYEDAMKMFTYALNLTKEKQIEDRIDIIAEEPRELRVYLDQLLAHSPPMITMARGAKDATAYVYLRAIVIPKSSSSSNKMEEKESSRTSKVCGLIVIFNLALSYHTAASYAQASIAKQKTYLRKAAKLYELAFELHAVESVGSTSFEMATINNLGLVYDKLSLRTKTQHCFQQMLSTMMYFVGRWDNLLSSADYEGFMYNVSTFALETKYNAAAA